MTYTLMTERTRSKWDKTHSKNTRFLRTGFLGLGTSGASASAFTVEAGQVALIDEVVMACLSNDGATNLTCNLRINGLTLPFHFPGTVDQRTTRRKVWRTKGNLVVQPGQTFAAHASANSAVNNVSCSARYRLMSLTEAIGLGEISGRMPQVASTNSVTGGGTAAATAKAIVPAVAGQSVEILGITCTGHNFNAAADDIRLGFWDGVTGTFTANGNMVMRTFARGVSSVFSPDILIGDCRVQGPIGSGVYIQASANLAGATPNADYNIIYRYTDTIDTWTPLGTVNTASQSRRNFWFFTEAAVSAAGTSVPWFPASTTGFGVRIKGWAASAVASDSGAASAEIGIGLGADHQFPLAEYLLLNSDGAGAPAAVSRSFFEDDMVIQTAVASAPAFTGIDATSIVTQRAQLVWGSLEQSALSGTEYITTIP